MVGGWTRRTLSRARVVAAATADGVPYDKCDDTFLGVIRTPNRISPMRPRTCNYNLYLILPGMAYNPPVAPVAYQVILEPGMGQFRELEPPRVHTRINSRGLFVVHKLTCGKRESVS